MLDKNQGEAFFETRNRFNCYRVWNSAKFKRGINCEGVFCNRNSEMESYSKVFFNYGHMYWSGLWRLYTYKHIEIIVDDIIFIR